MVRLEKVLYEKILNTKLLGRARNIIKPVQTDNQQEIYLRELPKTRLTQSLLRPFAQFIDGIEYRDWRSLCLQRGVSFDQVLMDSDMQLFRCPFHEHFLRESTHPYHHTLNKWSRNAYHKIDNYLRGFEAPDYFREPARKRTYLECKDKIDTYYEWVTKNYSREQTLSNHWYKGSIAVFELFLFYNSAMRMGWNRLFFNEEEYVSVKDFVKMRGYLASEKAIDLNDVDERKKFVKDVKDINKRYPGRIAPDGEDFDFENFFRKWDAKNMEKEFDGEVSEETLMMIDPGLSNYDKPFIISQCKGVEGPEEASGKNTIGIDLPKYLRNGKGAGLMN